MSKGLAFKLIAEVIIVLVAIFVIFSIFKALLPGYFGRAMCKVYQVILVIPLPEQIKPSISECDITPDTERAVITGKDIDKNLAYYIEQCWEKTDQMKSGQTFICYELFLKSITVGVQESDVAKILREDGYCDKIANNYLEFEDRGFDCGDENKLYWKIGEIKGKDITIIIKYDAFHHRIEVI